MKPVPMTATFRFFLAVDMSDPKLASGAGVLAAVRFRFYVVSLVVERRAIHAAFKIQQFDFAEVDWVRLALQRDITAFQQFAPVLFGVRGFWRARIPDLRQAVFQYFLAVYEVGDVA